VQGKTDAHFHAHIRSDPAEVANLRRTFERFVASHDFDTESADQIGLVINEALANIIRHAYKGRTDQPIAIKAGVDDKGIWIELRDWGNGVVPRVIDEREKDPRTPGGLGLPCMKKMTTALDFIPQPDGMILKLFRARGKQKNG
jgi:serine/threonine-protein kinase RsbW